jgi:hypothetical protein
MFISDGGWADEVTLQSVKSQESHILCGGNGSAKLVNPNIHRYFQAFSRIQQQLPTTFRAIEWG